jgi:hypothetical protein
MVIFADFFNCIHYSFGPWSIIFSMLCFLTSATGEQALFGFCSVFAITSSSIMLFTNPAKKYNVANRAWRRAAPSLELFLIQLHTCPCECWIKSALKNLSKEISDVSQNADI